MNIDAIHGAPRGNQFVPPVVMKGRAFGMTVAEQLRESLDLQNIDEGELDSILFEGSVKSDTADEGFVLVAGKDTLLRLQGKNPEVFAGLYNASPVPEPSESVFSRVCTLVTDIISAYLNTGQS
ncbi:MULTISPECIES: hypothetical protein [unclassified Endozoicomonas]|uniref:hypothetical protein n=1 Tax=unclassified Endozoicomonas TaxID=2644528 RepID=UPI003BB7CA27